MDEGIAVSHSTRFSSPDPDHGGTHEPGTRPSLDRLTLGGRAGQGVTAYRSDFLHAWVVETDPLSPLDSDDAEAALLDLEYEALHLSEGLVPPPASAIPNSVHHAFSVLQFLRESLWAGQPAVFGLVACEGRVWALQSGIDVTLDQLTGAPARVRWHEWEGGMPLAWCELGAADVWRLSALAPHGALHAHYRPPLAGLVVPGPADESFDTAPVTLPTMGESRHARRRRQRREAQRALAVADIAAPVIAPIVVSAAQPELVVAPEPPVVVASPAVLTPRVQRPPATAPAIARPAVQPRRIARPRLAIPRAWSIGVAAGAALAVVALAFTWGRKPIATFVVGEYTVDLASAPAGATIRVDGKPVAGRTPLALALAPGDHKVDLALGDYASATFNVEGQRGDRTARSVTWTGSLGVASTDTTAQVAVAFDGQGLGATPLWRDTVPVGRHRLSFHAPGIRAWREEVEIRSGQSTRVSAEPVRVPQYGLVTARAELVSSDGVEDLEGLPVFIDGERNGQTPVDLKLDPGPHSVRIARGDDAPSVHLIDVQAGGRYYATAQFGRPADPMVEFDAPLKISRAHPPTLAIRLAAELPLPVRQVWLYVKTGKGTFTRLPAELTTQNGRVLGTVAFPQASLAAPAASTLTYYVEIETREGEEYYSELRTVPLTP
jgi:hypothetical protein